MSNYAREISCEHRTAAIVTGNIRSVLPSIHKNLDNLCPCFDVLQEHNVSSLAIVYKSV